VIDTIVGLRSIDPAMLQLARSMGAPPYRIFLQDAPATRAAGDLWRPQGGHRRSPWSAR